METNDMGQDQANRPPKQHSELEQTLLTVFRNLNHEVRATQELPQAALDAIEHHRLLSERLRAPLSTSPSGVLTSFGPHPHGKE